MTSHTLDITRCAARSARSCTGKQMSNKVPSPLIHVHKMGGGIPFQATASQPPLASSWHVLQVPLSPGALTQAHVHRKLCLRGFVHVPLSANSKTAQSAQLGQPPAPFR
eukprot:3536458-Amphidinium_carterae.1